MSLPPRQPLTPRPGQTALERLAAARAARESATTPRTARDVPPVRAAREAAASRLTPASERPARPAVPPRSSGPSFTATVSTDDFIALCELVRQLCGVDLGQYKRNQMERRVRTWTERRGTPDLTEYGKLLKSDSAELDAFLDRVTINVSHLWRHEDQFEVLRTKILPELTATKNRLKIWSAGSSYGAEAYTIAAVCRETIPNVGVEINGTDLDKRMVARARTGVFTPEDARTSPKQMLQRHFDPQPDGGWVAKPELKRMVKFENGDLLRMPVPSERYDVVFCRNTVIYFTEEVRDALHARLVSSLAPGGYLVVGTSERVADPRGMGLTSPFHFIYRKG
ncbi:CheR family methyltransferase [Solirubrobacter soli]|uniref:CheR family methyltransferase n=1 Tax=Solirubrobacter soli TaxID=363832 RepID=UPI000404BB08|nr:protein-glutamate O-methyltransferase CheR [Solirubrobacter soli]